MEGRKRERERERLYDDRPLRVCARVDRFGLYHTKSESEGGGDPFCLIVARQSENQTVFILAPFTFSLFSQYIYREMWTEKKELPSDFVTFLLFNSRHIS